MRIERLDVYHVAMPLLYPWRTAYGEDYEIHSVLVRATSGDVTAWSESSPLFAPTYLTESAGGVFYHVTEILGPHVVGREYGTAGDLNARLGVFKGNQFAKAAIEIAWWTLQAKLTGTPLHRLLGGETREVVAGADFGIQDSIDMLLGNIQGAVDAGFPRIKLKAAPGWDLEMLRAVRSAFPDTTFHIDCNGGYTLDDLPMFREIDRLGLAFIEQPLNYADIIDHAELARQIETPVCLDESIVSVRVVEQALALDACRYVNIKPGRVGGLANAIAIHDVCREAGVPVWVGGMLESAVGAAICIELATLANFTYPGDLFPSSRFYERDLGTPVVRLTARNTFEPFTGPLPEPDLERLAEYTVRSATVVPAAE
ncbi:MAG: o-succinylbenzoate synthase [Dehalococcoidia bacterium]|jgi:O-succinylbenzoate synthase